MHYCYVCLFPHLLTTCRFPSVNILVGRHFQIDINRLVNG